MRKLPSSYGMVPVNIALCTFNFRKLVNVASSGGIDPVNVTSFRFNSRKLVNFQSVEGRDPHKLLSVLDKSNTSKAVKLPKLGGMVPVISYGRSSVAPCTRFPSFR